jgi:murein DD-endopeptidase MepM/ murein hydrolase activator NlpD
VDQFVDPRTRLSLRHRTQRFGARLATTDGRWALVSSSLTVLVAGAIGWMAMGTLPQAPAVRPNHTALPYELFLRLVRAGGAQQLASIAPQFAPQDQQASNSVSDVDSRTLTLDSGDTLAGAMEDAGVSTVDANTVITALGKDFNPRSLKAGMNFDITYNIAPTIDASGAPPAPKTTVVMVNHKPVTVPVEEDSDAGATAGSSQPISRLLSLHFSPSIEQDVTVTRDLSGAFTAQNDQKVLTVHHHRAGATIDSSLYLAGMQAGIPADIVVEMIRMFSYKVDFQRDLQPGDSFEVYYDYYYSPDGQPAKTGNISYARMHLGGKDVVLYRYAPSADEAPEYYDPKGQSAKGMLMKTPVDGARISSGFGSRLHPILGYTRMHKGVDFAVPTGTPVMAAGAGTINFMGWANGYGNFVVINHSCAGSPASAAARHRPGRSPCLGEPVARLGVERRARSCGPPAACAQPPNWMSTMRPCRSRCSRWNRMISSSRLRNSGRKCARTTAITWRGRTVLVLALRLVDQNSLPRFEVMTISVLRKSTVRPWPSVRRPSSSTCSSTLNTSGCAFSTSSNSIT